jgi:hypothetical protein
MFILSKNFIDPIILLTTKYPLLIYSIKFNKEKCQAIPVTDHEGL